MAHRGEQAPEEDHEGRVQMRRESMADMPVMHRDAGVG